MVVSSDANLSSPGVITIDGYDVRDLNPYWLRGHIGTVSQVKINCSNTFVFLCNSADRIHTGELINSVVFLLLSLSPLPQEPVLFSCSIRENIAYGAAEPDSVSTEDIYKAARVANAYDFIQAFPKGFDTVVGEKGVLLSGEEQNAGN